MNNYFSAYKTDYINGVMSLREPQKKSLEILDNILSNITPSKNIDLNDALSKIHSLYSTCTDFEREFISLTFALATGVGKTRLMGAFITYLYTNHNVKNFFVVAPNTTIYKKLLNDLSNPSNPKYVFKGLGCFSVPPHIYQEDDYRNKQITIYEKSTVNIFIYNIDKFNKEDSKMRRANEYLGNSFYDYISSLPDLVLIMDESHHYRAERGAETLNDLKPVLGLELTATPLVYKGNKQITFKNVVYEYALSKAISDGYVRTPYAMTRQDIDLKDFGDEKLDHQMLKDSVKCHEQTKTSLKVYAANHGVKFVKPFMLVVCKDTEHAEKIKDYICSDSFCSGFYRDKTIILHSKQSKTESEENTQKLHEVENPDNPIEIVIHVNKLKEGWDVNNLYTIVPLRTASSKILREQMVGRGLRLPYGKRTGETEIDRVTLAAHDKFNDIIQEAQRGESIFTIDNIIKAEDLETLKPAKVSVNIPIESNDNNSIEKFASERIIDKVTATIQTSKEHSVTPEYENQIVNEVFAELAENQDLAEEYRENETYFESWLPKQTRKITTEAQKKYIPIPKVRVVTKSDEYFSFEDFELDTSEFQHTPLESKIIIQSITSPEDTQYIKNDDIIISEYELFKIIIRGVAAKPEVNYAKDSGLIYKLTRELCSHYEKKFGSEGLKKIIVPFHNDISEMIFKQMLKHVKRTTETVFEYEVTQTSSYNIKPEYKTTKEINIYDKVPSNIRSVVFTGMKKSIFDKAQFDSYQGELTFAMLLEKDNDVIQWLRPSPLEFTMKYSDENNKLHSYEPDFVVETGNTIYLTEVKGENMLDTHDVKAKRYVGEKYCEASTRWGIAKGQKEWRYLFIPSAQAKPNSSFGNLVQRYGNL